MTVDSIGEILAWCTVLNYALLVIWFLGFVFFHDWMYHLHKRWFHLSVETFDTIHYAGMGLFKAGIIIFNLVPYLVIRFFV